MRILVLLLAAAALGNLLLSAAIITSVVESGGDGVPFAQWTGQTFTGPTIGTYTVGLFQEDAAAFCDRVHQWNGSTAALPIPNYLLGNEYIMIRNDDRDNASYRIDVTVSRPCTVYLLLDNRMPINSPNIDNSAANPPFGGAAPGTWARMTWVGALGFQPVLHSYNRTANAAWPDEIAIDEGGDGSGPGNGINNYASVYSKEFSAGTFSLNELNLGGGNMYGVVVAPSSIVDPPLTPAGLTEFSQDSKVTLKWNAVAASSGYVVKRATASGGPYTAIATNTTLSYVDATVVNGTVYYYVVAAINVVGSSPDSAEVVAHPNVAPVVVATGGTNQILLTWNSLPGALSYTVSRSLVSGGPYTVVASGIGAAQYLDTAVAGGASYYYLVNATLTGNALGGYSAQVQGLTAPSPLTNSYAELFAAAVAKVVFSTPDLVAPTITIEKSGDGTTYVLFTNRTATAGYALDVSLAPSTTIFYRLRASNATGFSPYEVRTVTTPSSGYNVNFANVSNASSTVTAPVPPGFVQDVGLPFGDRGNGFTYGWNRDITADGRYRQNANSPDLRYDTFNHLQKTQPSAIWEMSIPNGLYSVRVVAGDVTAVDSTFQELIEGTLTRTYVPVAGAWWGEFTNTVYVGDGALTITTGPAGANNKLDFASIYPAAPAPNILASNPVSLSLLENRTARFSVVISGGPEPYGIQWYFNGTPIDGANQATYIIPFVKTTDEGDYYAVVTNASVVVDPGTAVTSTSAHLAVTPDTEGPRIVSVGSLDGYSIGVCYNEMVNTNAAIPPALDPFSYAVTDSLGARTVNAIVLRPDLAAVQLIIDATAGPLAGPFTVTASGITDIAGNSTAESSGTNTMLGLIAQDVGTPAFAGTNFVCDSDRIELAGSGADIWGAADQFHLASKSVSGDFDARVRVIDLKGSNAVTKAALMVRETSAANSRTMHLSVNPAPPGRDQFQPGIRDVIGGGYGYWGTNYVPSAIPNAWLRITRMGDTFRGYRSTNGTDWILMAQTNQIYPASVLVGLGITAHDITILATGAFSGFNVTAISGTDLGLTQSAAPSVVPVSGSITYTMVVTNFGPAAADGVVVSDPLPAGVTFVSAVASQGSCSQAGGTVTCHLGALASGASALVTVVGTASTTGSKVNTASVSSTGIDLNPADNSATATVTVPVSPSVTTPVINGGTVSFSIATQPGVTYKVYYKNSLADLNWTLLTTVAGDGTVKPVSDPGPLPASRFYTVLP